MNLTPAQTALLTYMENASEARWSAGWLRGLEKVLKGDPGYDWLVKQAGGTFAWDKDVTERINGRNLKWIPNDQHTDDEDHIGMVPPKF